MVQFLIALSISAFVLAIILAIIYWSERIIFRRCPKAAANHVGSVCLCSEAGAVLAAFLIIAFVVAAVPLLCIYALRYVVLGREHAPLYPWRRSNKIPRLIP